MVSPPHSPSQSHPSPLSPSPGGLALTAALCGRAARQGQQDPDAESHAEHPHVLRSVQATKVLWALDSPCVLSAFLFSRCPSLIYPSATLRPLTVVNPNNLKTKSRHQCELMKEKSR